MQCLVYPSSILLLKPETVDDQCRDAWLKMPKADVNCYRSLRQRCIAKMIRAEMHCYRCSKHRCMAVDAQGRDASVDAQGSDALLYMLKAEMHHCRCSRQRFFPWGLQWNSSSWTLIVRICGSFTFGNALSLFLGLGLRVLRDSVTSFVSSQPLILHSLSFCTFWLWKPSFGVLASSRLYLNSLSGTLPFLMVLHHLALDGVLSFQWCSEFFVCFLVVAAIIVVMSGSPQAGCSRYLFVLPTSASSHCTWDKDHSGAEDQQRGVFEALILQPQVRCFPNQQASCSYPQKRGRYACVDWHHSLADALAPNSVIHKASPRANHKPWVTSASLAAETLGRHASSCPGWG